jgi:hypothetical protein
VTLDGRRAYSVAYSVRRRTRIRWTLALDPRLIARLGAPFATRAIRRLLARATTNLDARLAGAVVR